MTAGDVIWFFFIFSALQPVLKQRFLEATRQRLIGRIERERRSRVILLVHGQEMMSFLGFPVYRYIDVNDSEEVLRAIHLTDKNVPIDLVLHTPGGLVLAAMQIARAIHKHEGKVTAFVPHYAMSSGTLIALAADEIVMCFATGYGERRLKNRRVRTGQVITGVAAATRKTVVVNDVRRDARYIPAVDGILSEMAVPLVARGRVIGVIDFESTKVSIVGAAARKAMPVHVSDTRRDPRYLPAFANIRSAVAIPLLIANRVIGVETVIVLKVG